VYKRQVFTGGPAVDEVPPVWIDRVGFKANITEVGTMFCSALQNSISSLLGFSVYQLLCCVNVSLHFAELHTAK